MTPLGRDRGFPPPPGFNSRFRHGSFSESGHASDFRTGPPVATLLGALRCRVRIGLAGPMSVYRDCVRQKVTLTCRFCLNVAAKQIRPRDTHGKLLGR